MKATGNTILVTGGSSGIGRGLAERFHARGNEVVAAGRRREALAEVATATGIDSVVLDISDPASIEGGAAEVLDRHPGLNVLVNCAGIITWERFADPDHLAATERSIATNLLGPIRLTAALLPHLLDQDRPAIVTTTSGLAFVPNFSCPSYGATKAAIHSYTTSLRGQLSPQGVEVLELIPPSVDTPMHGGNPNPRAMPLDRYVDEVFEILDHDPSTRVVRRSRQHQTRCESRPLPEYLIHKHSTYRTVNLAKASHYSL